MNEHNLKIGDIVVVQSGIGLKPRLAEIVQLYEDTSLVRIRIRNYTTNTLSWKLELASDRRVNVVTGIHVGSDLVTITRDSVTAGCWAGNLVKLTDEEAMLMLLENA